MFRPATSILALLALCLLFCGSLPAQFADELSDDTPPFDLPLPDDGSARGTEGGLPALPDLGEPKGDFPTFPEGDDGAIPDTRQDPDSVVEPKTSEPVGPEPTRLDDYFPQDYDTNLIHQPYSDELNVDYMAPVYSSGDWINDFCWITEFEFILMHRTVGRGTLLGVDQLAVFDNVGTPIFDQRQLVTDNVGFRITPGARFRIGRYLARDHLNRDATVEAEYLGMFDWKVDTELRAATGGRILFVNEGIFTALDPFFNPLSDNRTYVIGGFNAADYQSFDYSSDLNSVELNVRLRHRLGRDRMVAMPDGTWSRQIASGVMPSYFFGMRYIQTQENLSWTSRRVDGDGNIIDPADNGFGGDYFIETHNDLVGTHIGGDVRYQWKHSYVGVKAKAGVMINFADMKRTISSDDPLADIPDSRVQLINGSFPLQSEQIATVALEAGFFGAYQVNPNIALRASYDMMWINGMALAPQQLTFEPSRARIDLGGNVFYQGLTTALEIQW